MRRVLFLACLLLILGGCAVVRLPLGEPTKPREVTLLGEGEDKVVMVDVSGVLSFQRPWALPGMPRGESLPVRVRQDLDRARRAARYVGMPYIRSFLYSADSLIFSISAIRNTKVKKPRLITNGGISSTKT